MSSLLNETEFSSEASNQHIKDIKLQVEYRYLAKNAPGGVFIMPEFNDIRKYHGVIFVKKGLYRDGIFRFTLVLPKEYNDVNTYPEITFTPPIFNPFIDPMTGILDLKQDPDKATWQPDKHYIRDALYFLKRSFYMKDFSVFENVANEEARKLFKDDKECYAELVSKCVKESCLRMLDEPEDPNCTIIFTEPKPAHSDLLQKILGEGQGISQPSCYQLDDEALENQSEKAINNDD